MKIEVHHSAHSTHIVLCSVLGVMILLHMLHNWLPLIAVEVTCQLIGLCQGTQFLIFWSEQGSSLICSMPGMYSLK